MILTTCPACAAPLAHNAPRCVRCHLRYCNATDPAATLADLREAVTTLEDVERIERRLLGDAHPHVSQGEHHLRDARNRLRALETPPNELEDA